MDEMTNNVKLGEKRLYVENRRYVRTSLLGCNSYILYYQKWENKGILYYYDGMCVDRDRNLVLCNYFHLGSLDIVAEKVTPQDFKSYVKMESDEQFLEFGLSPFEDFMAEDIKYTDYKDSTVENLSDGERCIIYPSVRVGYADNAEDGYPFSCLCLNCGKTGDLKIKKDAKYCCPHCGKEYTADLKIEEKRFSNYLKYLQGRSDKESRSEKTIYVRPIENGIEIYNITCSIGTKENLVTRKTVCASKLTYVVGDREKSRCVKYGTNGKETVCDALETLNFNKNFITGGTNAVYEGENNLFEFIHKNERLLSKMGYFEFLRFSNRGYDSRAIFFYFIILMTEFPQLELLIKSGQSGMLFGLFHSLQTAQNKSVIKDEVKKLEELIDTNATSGKSVLRIPTFICDFLTKKGASMQDFYQWRDIYELCPMTKEQFDMLTTSCQYVFLAAKKFPIDGNLLKYGYPLGKLMNYLYKQCLKFISNMESLYDVAPETVANILKDYLEMCEVMGVVPDLYPQNLMKQHNDIVVIRNKQLKELAEKRHDERVTGMTEFSKAMEEYLKAPERDKDGKLPPGIPEDYDKYIVKIPTCEADFISEGNMQHNCVAGYYKRVLNGECNIFFLREKNAPNQSFITGERCCLTGSLKQFLFANNRTVYNDRLKKIGNYVARKIGIAINSGAVKF